jgi:undecaprenyl-diphosphatase
MSQRNAAALAGVAALSALGYAVVSSRVYEGKTKKRDARAKRRIKKLRTEALRRAAELSGPLGKWYGHVPVALLVSGWLRKRQRRAAAATVTLSSTSALALSHLLERAMKRRSPPPERGEPAEPSYPSNHALESAAVALVSSYVLVRERLASPWIVAPLGATALASGLGRLLLDRHWASDSTGGYFAGTTLAAACASLYELGRDDG